MDDIVKQARDHAAELIKTKKHLVETKRTRDIRTDTSALSYHYKDVQPGPDEKKAATLLTRLADEVERLREALGEVSGQPLSGEMPDHILYVSDFQYGYDEAVRTARRALAGEQGDG